MMSIVMTNEEMDKDLAEVQTYLSCTRLTADRCRHESTVTTSIWVFDGEDKFGRKQIACMARLEEPYERNGTMYRWRCSTLHGGIVANGVYLATMLDCLGHVMRGTKGD
jgi:hypothetical protein